MQLNLISYVIFIFVCAASFNLYAWNPFKAQTYDECILENMKGVTSNEAAKEIKFACEIKMYSNKTISSPNKCKNRKLTAEETKLITGNAVVEGYGFLKVKLYNGNRNLKITGVKVRLFDKEAQKSFDFDMSNANVEPISTSGEMLAELLYAPKKWDWYIYEMYTEVCN